MARDEYFRTDPPTPLPNLFAQRIHEVNGGRNVMIIPDSVIIYMNGRAYYAHVCGFYWEGKRLSLQIDASCLKGGGAEVKRMEPPRREITINAQINGKSVNITYDPHDAEAVKAAETWRKALFADGTRFKAVEPVTVKAGDVVAFAEPSESALDAVFERIRREGYCCPSCGRDSLRQAAEPLRDYLKAHGDPHTSVIVTQDGVTETQDERRVTFNGEKAAETVKSAQDADNLTAKIIDQSAYSPLGKWTPEFYCSHCNCRMSHRYEKKCPSCGRIFVR